jgi:hypothetical protein
MQVRTGALASSSSMLARCTDKRQRQAEISRAEWCAQHLQAVREGLSTEELRAVHMVWAAGDLVAAKALNPTVESVARLRRLLAKRCITNELHPSSALGQVAFSALERLANAASARAERA